MPRSIPIAQGASHSIGACTVRAPVAMAGHMEKCPLTPF